MVCARVYELAKLSIKSKTEQEYSCGDDAVGKVRCYRKVSVGRAGQIPTLTRSDEVRTALNNVQK